MLGPNLAAFINSVKDMGVEVKDDHWKVEGDETFSTSKFVLAVNFTTC